MIFISHAAADRPIVDPFYTLLQTGCSVRQEEIFCTSIEGSDVRTGEDFVHWIREHLSSASLVILIVTPNYLDSRFCIAEMGASWALEKEVFPLVADDVERDLGSVFLGRQTDRIDQTGLNNLYDRIAAHFTEVHMNTARWDVQKSTFLKEFARKYSELPRPQLVSREEFDAEHARTTAALEINEELREQNREFERQIELLEKAKDATEVQEIRREFASDRERYDHLVGQVRSELKGLDQVELRCVYATAAGTMWSPSRRSWDLWLTEIDRARERDWISGDDRDEPRAFSANQDHPRYRELFSAIGDLEEYLELEISESLHMELEEEGEHYVRMSNREYWEDELIGEELLD